ncbi:unnamed protein product [Cyberlindnera jadinii]|uniref:Chromatin modification-related protein EAF6 n=1 Tax=Cyberlindnera jadinii (strain ATCC 18201 / CBS 1600 / BCRC 20928 / JCM 3617 / NBRC 0987 / NRRL Y-1542) TaxID=983966 RepID=A0A0H5CCW3_CYBJN|nr:unnamed protein product [Cyberlindnera jadinii]
MPDIKEYEQLKKQLQQAILKKKQLDQRITLIEEDIFQKESAYLAQSNGSIVRGFENLKQQKKRPLFTDDDRVFSLSSYTFVRHLQKQDDDDSVENTPSTGTKKRKREP